MGSFAIIRKYRIAICKKVWYNKLKVMYGEEYNNEKNYCIYICTGYAWLGNVMLSEQQ